MVTGNFHDDGDAGDTPTTAYLYDKGSGQWSRTPPLVQARNRHSAVVLDDGRVLVAGGFGADGRALTSSELYTHRPG